MPTATIYSTRSAPCPTQRSHLFVVQLNQEWDELRNQRATWIHPSSSLNDILMSVRFNPDRVLGELIKACQSQFSIAGRVIIQALLPKLILLSRAYPYPGVDHLVAAAWIRIARYPLVHRPTAIAANLILDAKKDVVSELRNSCTTHTGVKDHGFTARNVIDTARTLNLATPETLTIVENVYVDGLSSQRVAELHSISPEAVRRRCSDTIRRLKTHRYVLAELAAA